ncbi:MAG: hypothetical protein WAV15_02745 [Minisyncoccia bacterium]
MITINKKDRIILKSKNQEGYAILELFFYVSFLSLLSLVVINSMITMAQSFKETETQSELLRAGGAMERISREIRQAESINLITGTSLKLNTRDEDGNSKTVEFALLNFNIRFLENDVFIGNLNTPNIIVSSLSFAEITTTEGKAVKVTLSIQSTNDKYGRTVDFFDTVGLRGSY